MASDRYYSTSLTPTACNSLNGHGHIRYITAPSGSCSAIIRRNSYGDLRYQPGYTNGRRHTNMWCSSY